MSTIELAHLVKTARLAMETSDVKQSLDGFSGFPIGCCTDASLLLGQILKEYSFNDFELIRGECQVEREDGWGSIATHAWLENSEYIIDITADQFDNVSTYVLSLKTSPVTSHLGFTSIQRDPIDLGYTALAWEAFKTQFLRLFCIQDSPSSVQCRWENLVDKAYEDYGSLASEERIWFNIQALIGDVENGGVISHYYNSGADRIFDTIEDLNSLGYADISEVLEKINSLFPDGTAITDSEQRNKVIETWDGSHDHTLEYLDAQFFQTIPQLESSLVRFINSYIILKRQSVR